MFSLERKTDKRGRSNVPFISPLKLYRFNFLYLSGFNFLFLFLSLNKTLFENFIIYFFSTE